MVKTRRGTEVNGAKVMKTAKTTRKEPLPKHKEEILAKQCTFTALPQEIRDMVYEYFVDFTGVRMIYAEHEVAKGMNADAVNLLQFNNQIRKEFQELYYANQPFEIRSVPGITGFLRRVGPFYSSLIRHIEIGPSLAHRKDFELKLPEVMAALPAVERLVLSHASKDWIRVVDATTLASECPPRFLHSAHFILFVPLTLMICYHYAEAGPRTKALLRAAPSLRNGSMIFITEYGAKPQLHFVPSATIYSDSTDLNWWPADPHRASADQFTIRLPIPGDLEPEPEPSQAHHTQTAEDREREYRHAMGDDIEVDVDDPKDDDYQ